jgi:hypothetical protein
MKLNRVIGLWSRMKNSSCELKESPPRPCVHGYRVHVALTANATMVERWIAP